MKPRLDLQKSIKRQRLIYRKTPLFFLNLLLNNAIWVLLLVAPILLISNPKNNIGVLGVFILTPFILFLCAGMYFINTLVLIQGSNLEDNRKRIIQLARDKFPDMTIDETGKNIILLKRKTGFTTWGKQLTIIFTDKNVLINSATIGRHELKSPFHSISNYVRMKKLSKVF